MFSTQSKTPIDVADPGKAVVTDLQKFGYNLEQKKGDVNQVLPMIGQTDSTSVVPSIKKHGEEYLSAFNL
jgi:hypothetical protein